jgi:hypothetical protein
MLITKHHWSVDATRECSIAANLIFPRFSAAGSGVRTTNVFNPREASWSAVALYSFSDNRINPA